ncbi:hypothetical protein SSBP1_gp07 [Synechococcus phage S-SBP1]|uniref:Uncharacterized protein n=1 Tax=Synechococcus phage S-SBP1 TaxID=2735125 RepID=A0A6M4EN27_9CAUD|nr:hypothetical protein SSBP1_gp07 [Synechococcus phage S-SBP1]
MKVYTLRYKTAWSGDEMLMVNSNLRAVINRLEIMDLHDNFDEDETVIIECMEVTSEETSLERLNNIRKHYAEKNK